MKEYKPYQPEEPCDERPVKPSEAVKDLIAHHQRYTRKSFKGKDLTNEQSYEFEEQADLTTDLLRNLPKKELVEVTLDLIRSFAVSEPTELEISTLTCFIDETTEK